ncbi:MAG: ABC transporter substrate-binding protein [Deltaproteobacteria bacterium]|nr:ABC transporter substrate-binding protein [Deltaproteobacteria bacterium]
MTGRIRLLVIITVVASLFLFTSFAGAAEKVLKVGVMGPFTGPSAKAGKEFKDSVKMALDKIGGKVGPYKIVPVWVDSQSDPAKATNAFAEACERKGIVAGCINWHSSVAIACMDLAAQYKVPWLFGMGAAQLVVTKWQSNPEKYSYWSAKAWPVPGKLEAGQSVAFMNYAIKNGIWKPKNKKAAIFGEDTDWGRNAGENLKAALKAGGWEIVYEDYFALTQTDFYPLLSKYKKAGVSFVGGTTTSAPSMTGLVKQFREVGVKALLFANGLSWVGEWYKLTGKASNGVIDVQAQFGSQAAKAFAKAKQARFGYAPSAPASGLSYDGFNFFIKVLKRTLEKYGKITSEDIHKVVVDEVNTGKLTYTAAEGSILMKEYKWTPKTNQDPVVDTEHYFFPVIQYENGKSSIIFPESMKEKAFTPPM